MSLSVLDIPFMIINELKDVLLIVLGWFLGLLAPVIVVTIQNKREAKIVKAALFTELRELRCRLVFIVYRVEEKYGELNREFFEWAQSILSECKGIDLNRSLLEGIGQMLELTDKEIASFDQRAKEQNQPDLGLSLKKLSLPLLESTLVWLLKFDSVLQAQLLEIKTHLGFMNEIIDDSRYYFGLSFQKDISSENYQRAKTNMINSYKDHTTQAKVVIKIIDKILSKK